MPTLLVVHHTPSPAMQAMLEAVRAGAGDPDIEGVDVVVRPALGATVSDLLAADGVVLGTPANMGYMSGALKHWFDQVYYPVLEATAGTPYALYVHGQNGTTGAVRSVEQVAASLKWKAVTPALEVIGEPGRERLDACRDLGGVVAATIAG